MFPSTQKPQPLKSHISESLLPLPSRGDSERGGIKGRFNCAFFYVRKIDKEIVFTKRKNLSIK